MRLPSCKMSSMQSTQWSILRPPRRSDAARMHGCRRSPRARRMYCERHRCHGTSFQYQRGTGARACLGAFRNRCMPLCAACAHAGAVRPTRLGRQGCSSTTRNMCPAFSMTRLQLPASRQLCGWPSSRESRAQRAVSIGCRSALACHACGVSPTAYKCERVTASEETSAQTLPPTAAATRVLYAPRRMSSVLLCLHLCTRLAGALD